MIGNGLLVQVLPRGQRAAVRWLRHTIRPWRSNLVFTRRPLWWLPRENTTGSTPLWGHGTTLLTHFTDIQVICRHC
ncbi:hypothetical protein WJX74_009749 [Apatococcus lobatus]|uniref:Uncharacterized protein n=1 Tax=Apatococcus lobatus TaxID=904363 RepID=A0AAW1S437_9CHLO